MIKFPNKWNKRVRKEKRFRPDYGETKAIFSQITKSGYKETEDRSFVEGYRQAIKDMRFLNPTLLN